MYQFTTKIIRVIILEESSDDMKRRKIKKTVIKKGILILIPIIILIITLKTISVIKYHKTNEYKLKKIGYSIEEIKIIETTTDENITYILNNEYNEIIDDLISEKYFIDKNLERYINYKINNNKELNEIVSLVNVGRDNEYYTNTKTTDTSKNELMLVNKYYYLDKTYEPQNIITIPIRYAYSDNKTSEEILEKYKEMFFDAEKEGIKLVISSSYRTYEDQEETYEYYKKIKGEENIDTYAARPGYSEHQTGLAFDILTIGITTTQFESTKEFKWLQENAYKYGFILRYPKDKEEITGYEYESWHYRYVGKEAAKIIHDENITFDEYYAYYIEK